MSVIDVLKRISNFQGFVPERDDNLLELDFERDMRHLCSSILEWFRLKLPDAQIRMVYSPMPMLFIADRRLPVLMVMHGTGSEDVQWFRVMCFYSCIRELNQHSGAKVCHSYLFQGFNTNFWNGCFECDGEKWVPGCMRRAFDDLHELLLL